MFANFWYHLVGDSLIHILDGMKLIIISICEFIKLLIVDVSQRCTRRGQGISSNSEGVYYIKPFSN